MLINNRAILYCSFLILTVMLFIPSISFANTGKLYTTTERILQQKELPKTNSIRDSTIITARGMHSSFQIGFQPSQDGYSLIRIKVTAGSKECSEITHNIYRVVAVYIPSGSTGMNTKSGYYPDALAPQVSEQYPLGWNQMIKGRNMTWMVDSFIPYGKTPEVCYFALEIHDVNHNNLYTLPLAIKISHKTLPSRSSKHFPKLIMGWEMDNYRSAMGGGDYINYAREGASFLKEFGITPYNQWKANPSSEGKYSCSKMEMNSFALGNVRVIPNYTPGCDSSIGNADDYRMIFPYGESVKQDDRLKTSSFLWAKRVYGFWKQRNYLNKTTYIKNPFDEPSDVTKGMRYTMSKEVPKANRILRRAMPGVKVFLASWPRDERKIKKCRIEKKKHICIMIEQDKYGNRNMWNGGLDDPHVWVIQPSRLYGRVNAASFKKYKYSRTFEYLNRLNKLKKQGKEIWSYNFFSSTNKLPQTVIDAPATHSKLLMLQLGKEGFHGMYISNGIWYRNGKNSRQIVNPWNKTPSYYHKNWGIGWGWGSYVYPGINHELGLNLTRPLPSLRLINMRNGSEEAAMLNLYRAEKGEKRAKQVMSGVFGSMRRLPPKHGQTVWPFYSQSEPVLSSRIEKMRWHILND